MGFDGLISFLIRNLPNDAFDDIDLNINHNKLLSKNVLIDISFILYNCYLEVEDDINTILKYICGISCSNYSKIINLIEAKLISNHWKNIDIQLDGLDQNEICKNFIESICKNDNEIIDNIMLKNINEKLEKILENIFAVEIVNNIVLFFDSIPSYSKILEQRKRRLKNYMESQNRKEYYKKYFTDLKSKIIYDEEEDFEYDYFSWISNKFSCNKIIDSNSIFIKKLKNHIIDNLNLDKENKIKINVDSEEYGEADYKIFKYISINNLDDIITILSCDSDLVYQIITQQLNYNSMGKEIKLNLCKFYINSFDHCQHYNANKIINNLNTNYKECNNCSKENEFCLDFMIILNFFGNDLLPSSFEIGPEFNLNTLMKIHYNSLGKYGKSLIEMNNEKSTDCNRLKTLNFNNLSLLLKEINKNTIFTKIILLRFFKIPYNIVSIFTDKLNFSLIDVKNFMEEYLVFKGYLEIEKKNNELDSNDIRFIKYNEYKNKIEKELNSQDIDNEKIVDVSGQVVDDNASEETCNILLETIENNIRDPLKCNNSQYNTNMSSIMTQLESLLEDYLDYSDLDNLGLLNSYDSLDIDNNMYQNLYNYISNKSNLDRGTFSNFKLLKNDQLSNNMINIKLGNKDEKSYIKNTNKNKKILIDFNLKIESCEDEQIENYLMMLFYIVKNFFNDMSNYSSTNLSVYKYDNVPSLKNIIDFIDTNKNNNLSIRFNKQIDNNIINKDKYFNPILHHLIITPYLLESNYINLMSNKDILNEIIKNFDSILSNIWNYECYNFNFIKSNMFIKDKLKYIDPKLILESWNQILVNIHKTKKIEYDENILINF
jgi:hypothetical protein